jgi:hypothetical protein
MKPTDFIRHEHQIILTVLDTAMTEARSIQNGGVVRTG